MKYVGSKNRLSKYIVPIIQSKITKETNAYIEPFCGGCNIIDKIKCKNRYASDLNKYLISLLKVARDNPNIIPKTITEEIYNNVRLNKDNYDDWYVGLVGFCSTYGAKWFGGYARGYKNDGKTKRDMSSEAIRNLKKQSVNLNGIKFKCQDYLSMPTDISENVIYCDPPYKGTTGYKDGINYNQFYEWVRKLSRDNIVLISEYNMPSDFRCIWEHKHETTLDTKKHKERIERLWVYNG